MKSVRTFDLKTKPLAASLALLLAVGTASAESPMTKSPENSGFRAVAGKSARHALRQRQRAERAMTIGAHRAAPSAIGGGATLPVTSCGDDADDQGTLRNVLATAAEGDTVDLSALTCSTITLVNGPIDTSALGAHQLYDVTLQGPGRDALTIDAAGQSQVFVVGGFSGEKGTFTANDLTIANGSYDGSLAACVEGFGGTVALNRVDVTNCHASGTYSLVFGGAVDVNFLVMTDSTITNSTSTATGTANTASGGGAYVGDDAVLVRSTIEGNALIAPVASTGDGYYTLGGGMYVRGDLTMTDSTISGNSIEATGDDENARGGGIYVRGITEITGSTIDGNTADGDGGGVFKAIYSVYGEPGGSNPTTKLTIRNSTFAGNTASRGGAIASSRPIYLANSTIATNTAAGGAGGILFILAGVTDSSGILVADSAIIAGNTSDAGAPFAPDLGADDALNVSGSNDLVVDAGDIVLPADTLNADPMLGPLQNNGGPTETFALLPDSPAIDAGSNPFDLAFDQRGDGFARVAGVAPDIGAFEVQDENTDTIFADGFDGPL